MSNLYPGIVFMPRDAMAALEVERVLSIEHDKVQARTRLVCACISHCLGRTRRSRTFTGGGESSVPRVVPLYVIVQNWIARGGSWRRATSSRSTSWGMPALSSPPSRSAIGPRFVSRGFSDSFRSRKRVSRHYMDLLYAIPLWLSSPSAVCIFIGSVVLDQ